MRVRPRTSGSITDLLLALACVPLWLTQHLREANPEHSGAIGFSKPPPMASLQMRDWGYWKADVSPVIGINQTNHSTDQERPCTTIHWIKKELSICPS